MAVKIGPPRRAEVLVHDFVEGELDVFGFEVFAVVEFDTLAQVERNKSGPSGETSHDSARRGLDVYRAWHWPTPGPS